MKINKIEKDVTIPVLQSKYKYPWEEIEVGDSVFFQSDEGETILSHRHECALVPIELANGVASLSSYPSAAILKIFADID